MADRPSLLPIALVSLTGLLVARVPTPSVVESRRGQVSPPSSGPAQNRVNGNPACCGTYTLRPLAEFLGRQLEATCPQDGAFQQRALAELLQAARPLDAAVLVATVPDPIDSHFDLEFDRSVEALQRGAEAAGFVLDRFALPWWDEKQADQRKASGSREISVTCTSLPGGAQGKATPDALCDPKTPLHAEQPGALLFRSRDRRGLLMVLLVGETITGGIHKNAFVRALALAHTAAAAGAPVRVLGPHFSGSADSLRRGIESWRSENTQRRKILVISGSGTAVEGLEKLPDFEFHATVAPGTVLAETFYKLYLKARLKGSVEKAALLIEADSFWGQEQRRHALRQPEYKFGLIATFPMHLAEVRSGYEQLRVGAASAMPEAPTTALDLSLRMGRQPHDILPSFSELTSRSDDRVLSNIFTVIREKSIRYVGILASDVQDILFLARLVRQECPDVSLFTFGSDILYTHPQYSSALRGLLVAASYPLSPAEAFWGSDAPNSHLEFGALGSMPAEGTFNALVALLGRDDLLRGYRSPSGGLLSLPPVWVTAVGHGRLWPLGSYAFFSQLPPFEDYIYTPKVPAPAPLPRTYPPAKPFYVLLGLTTLFCALISRAYLRRVTCAGIVSTPHVPGVAARSSSLWPVHMATDDHPPWLALHLLFGSLLVIYSCFVALLLTRSRDPARPVNMEWEWLSDWLPVLAVLICVGGLVRANLHVLRGNWRAWRAGGQAPGSWRRNAAGALFLLAALAFVIAILTSVWRARFPVSRFLFFLRTVDMLGGLSVVWPFTLLMLVICVSAWCHVRRVKLFSMHLRGYDESFRILGEDSAAGVNASARSLIGAMGDGTHPSQSLCWLAVAAISLAAWWRHPIATLEASSISNVFHFLIFLAMGLIAVSVIRFWLVWWRLSDFLCQVAWRGLAPAFRRLPESLARDVWKLFDSPPDLTALQEATLCWRTLVNVVGWRTDRRSLAKCRRFDAVVRGSAGLLEQAEKHLANALSHIANQDSDCANEERQEARRLVVDFGIAIGPALEELRQDSPERLDPFPVPEAAEQRDTSVIEWIAAKEATPSAIRVRVAEEFLAIRIAAFVHNAVAHMSILLTFFTSGMLLVAAAFAIYPFQPRRMAMMLLWSVVLPTVGATLVAFAQMDRNLVLSNISRTIPGKLTWSWRFVSYVGLYVLLPIVSLLAAQFPEAGSSLLPWASPVTKLLR